MLAMARLDAATIARLVPIRAGATHLLDLAGSHGLLGAEICRRHPPMRSTVVDLPEAVEEGRALARETGNADLVDHRAGDVRTDSLEECDAVLLASILHHFIPADITPLIARVRNALRPGGTVAIWDLESPPRGGPVGHGDVVSLFFRLDVECGRLSRNGLRELAARPTLLRRQSCTGRTARPAACSSLGGHPVQDRVRRRR